MSALNTFKVAVIGGGAAGLASVKYLLAEVFQVTLIEKRSELGGIWTGEGFCPQGDGLMYNGLETNVTRAMMTYTDHQWDPATPLFPRNAEVKKYLQEYADGIRRSPDGLRSLTCYVGTEVTNLRCNPQTGIWSMDLQSTHDSSVSTTLPFKGVVVAAGSENVINMPEPEPGREEWEARYPGTILHSSEFQSAEFYRGKRVLIVGNGGSGISIGSSIHEVTQDVVFSTRNDRRISPGVLDRVGPIVSFNAINKTVCFGKKVNLRFDCIIYCTGFFYDFPFLRRRNEPLFETSINIPNLYEHIFFKPNLSLAFVGLPRLVPTFNVAEAQAAVVARAWSGRIPRPNADTMARWEQDVRSTNPDMMAAVKFGLRDPQYINRLYQLTVGARPLARETENISEKLPPYYCRCMANARALAERVKDAYREEGSARFGYTTYESLGLNLIMPCPKTGPNKPKPRACTCFIIG